MATRKRTAERSSSKGTSGNKTVPRKTQDLKAFLDAVEPRRQDEVQTLLALFARITGQRPVLWGTSIIGYGQYHYRYASGREGDSLKCGFSPRKAELVLYVMAGFEDAADLRDQLGPHRVGKSCLYIRRLAAIDLAILEQIIERDWAIMSERYDP